MNAIISLGLHAFSTCSLNFQGHNCIEPLKTRVWQKTKLYYHHQTPFTSCREKTSKSWAPIYHGIKNLQSRKNVEPDSSPICLRIVRSSASPFHLKWLSTQRKCKQIIFTISLSIPKGIQMTSKQKQVMFRHLIIQTE